MVLRLEQMVRRYIANSILNVQCDVVRMRAILRATLVDEFPLGMDVHSHNSLIDSLEQFIECLNNYQQFLDDLRLAMREFPVPR